MADQNTAVKISLLFKDTSNDNYFSKYSSHILATLFILFIIFGLITYYKIKSELGSYKYRKNKKGELLWPDEKCLPHILPIAGHISRSPGETADEATYRNFEECVESMVKDKNNEYINPFNEIVAAALALSGTVMAGFGFVLNSVVGLADYIKNRFGELGNILSRMQNEIKSILKNQIFDKLWTSYNELHNTAGKHIMMLKNVIKEMIMRTRLDFFKTALYYIYYTLLTAAYEMGAGFESIFSGGGKADSGSGYYHRIYKFAAEELKKKLGIQQAFFTAYGTPLAPHIVGDDSDTVKLMDQNYTLFASGVYSDGWHDYSDTQEIEFIQPMSELASWTPLKNIRNARFVELEKAMNELIEVWTDPKTFYYSDYYFTEKWRYWKNKKHQQAALRDVFKGTYEWEEKNAKGPEMSDKAKGKVTLKEENIYLPLDSAEMKNWTEFHTDEDQAFLFTGTYNQLKQIPGGDNNDEIGYYAERRDMTLGLVFQQYKNAEEALTEIKTLKTLRYKEDLMNKCITITYVDKTVPQRVLNTLLQLNRKPPGGWSDDSGPVAGGDKSNQWIDVSVEKKQIYISKVEWKSSTETPPAAPADWEVADEDKYTHLPSYFRGLGPAPKDNVKNPFRDNPIWFSTAGDYTWGERTAFLFDKTINKIEVQLGEKKGKGAKGYHNGLVRFKLQRYNFTPDGYWGNAITINQAFDRNSDPLGQTAAIQEFNKKCPKEKYLSGTVYEEWNGMDSAAPNSAFCRVFGRPTIDGNQPVYTDTDTEDKMTRANWNRYVESNKKNQFIYHKGIGKIDGDIAALDPQTYSFWRKNAKQNGAYLSAWQMEAADWASVKGPFHSVNAQAKKAIEDILYELRMGDKNAAGDIDKQNGGDGEVGHKAKFNVHDGIPALSRRKPFEVEGHDNPFYVGKTCVTTGGDGTRNSTDIEGREDEYRSLKNSRDSFGMVNKAKNVEADKTWPKAVLLGYGDASETNRWNSNRGEVDGEEAWTGSTKAVQAAKDGWAIGAPIFPTVWSKQTEKQEAGQDQPKLFDFGGTTVCEPGWEFNLGPYAMQHQVKIDNRHTTHTCVMKNLTLYSKLQFCFGIDSPIFLNGGKKINIQDVQLGDILADGSVVTNTAVSEIGDNIVYMMPSSEQPILVSNKHKVELITFDDEGLRHKQFIKSEEHPDAIKYEDYKHDLLYCISTNTSRIVINDYVFQDWNEIGAIDYYELFNFFNRATYFKHLNKFGIFLDDAVREMIHTQLASGLWGKTPIRLYNKSVCNLDEVKIGDFLTSGEKILSIIKTKCDDVTIYKHKIQGKTFYGSKNISYYPKHQKTPVAINLLMEADSIKQDALPDGDKVLYHFITNSGVVPINGVNIAYHNHALQHILSI